MNSFLNYFEDETNVSFTENGARTNATTKSALLDAFGRLGSSIYRSNDEIKSIFIKAYNENRELALRYLFYLRDVRGGQGMRNAFRVCVLWLADAYPKDVINNIENIPYYGRWDDALFIYNNCLNKNVIDRIVNCIACRLKNDLRAYSNKKYGDISLLAKWMPSINTSSDDTRALANKLRADLHMSPASYRKTLSRLRRAINVVEVDISGKTYENIDYSAVPSKAAQLYSNAFYKHDTERYFQYLTDLEVGNSEINASALFPFDIVKKVMQCSGSNAQRVVNDKLCSAQWAALPDYFKDREETGLCVVDVSGSMQGTPMTVALSLGLYCADKCRGPYKDHFITFSSTPELQKITGETLREKLSSMRMAGWGMNTNLEAVFELILDIAVKNNLKQEDIPNKLYIISDMQFDEASKDPSCRFMDSIKNMYAEAGYAIPSIVYWNVGSYASGIFHQTINDTDFCMISGYSSSLFKSVIDGTEFIEQIDVNGDTTHRQQLDPINVMMAAIMNERYDRVWAA